MHTVVSCCPPIALRSRQFSRKPGSYLGISLFNTKQHEHVFLVVCRWFGLGFLLYWCIGTPLLFKSYRFGYARGFWQHTATQHNLWATYYLSLVSFSQLTLSGRAVGMLGCVTADLTPFICVCMGNENN